ncbi:MAG TPA: ABC transporter permease, partial [Candidatus Krumholzibacterium sp.]|nr:ABC transporter permease [Candidatus Krumholzibacterium sp.]
MSGDHPGNGPDPGGQGEKRKSGPPRFAEAMLDLFTSSPDKQTIAGDLEEYFHEIRGHRGRSAACRGYWWQVICACARLASNSLVWKMSMLRSYMVLAMRNLRKDKVYSFINIYGLALGLACSFLIAIWVVDELGFDRYHKDSEDIYRIIMVRSAEEYTSVYTPILLAEALERDLAPIVDAALLFKMTRKLSIRCGEKYFLEGNSLVSDNRFFRVFDVGFLRGSPETALVGPGTVVLSESAARKYFGAQDPMGRTIEISTTGREYEVTGVVRDCPS